MSGPWEGPVRIPTLWGFFPAHQTSAILFLTRLKHSLVSECSCMYTSMYWISTCRRPSISTRRQTFVTSTWWEVHSRSSTGLFETQSLLEYEGHCQLLWKEVLSPRKLGSLWCWTVLQCRAVTQTWGLLPFAATTLPASHTHSLLYDAAVLWLQSLSSPSHPHSGFTCLCNLYLHQVVKAKKNASWATVVVTNQLTYIII